MASGLSSTFDTATPALIFKTNRYPFHHGALGIIRSLGRVGVPVHCMHDSWFSPASMSRYQEVRLFWRLEDENADQLLGRLSDLGARLGRRTVLIPTDDAGAIFVAEHADGLAEWFLFPRPPAGLPRSVANKQELYDLCRRLAVPHPVAAVPNSMREVEEFLDRAVFPVIVKGVEPWRLPKAANLRSTMLLHRPDELLDIYRRVEGAGDSKLLLQEFIPTAATGSQDWFFHGYCDATSRCLVSFTGTKVRSSPPHAGGTSLGRSVDNQALRERSESLLRTIAYRGVVDLDYRLDPRDGKYKLLDFNPRVGAQFRLFEDESGTDVVRALHREMTGRPILRRPQVNDRVFIVENEDLVSSVRYWRNHELTPRQWVASLRGGSHERAWLAVDDLLPAVLMWTRFGLLAIGFAFRRIGTQLVSALGLGWSSRSASGGGNDEEPQLQ